MGAFLIILAATIALSLWVGSRIDAEMMDALFWGAVSGLVAGLANHLFWWMRRRRISAERARAVARGVGNGQRHTA
jgi:hypothetical protein